MVGQAPVKSEANVSRETSRTSSRKPERLARREPHEKFDVDPAHVPPGMVAEWKCLSVMGQVNRGNMIEMNQAGWTPAKAEQFPEHSGYGLELGGGTIPTGIDQSGKAIFLQDAQAGDPIVKDGQILMLRPKEMAQQFEKDRVIRSVEQTQTQIERLRGQSKRQVGEHNTKIQKRYVGRPDTDEA